VIFTLTILIDLLLIFAVWRTSKIKAIVRHPAFFHDTKYITNDKETRGKLDKIHIECKIAEKMADRAFNMASSANLGVIALQKALAVPRLLTKEQGQRNELAKQNIDALFSGGDALDFLKPIATEEELLAIEKIQEDKRKQMLNGNKNT